MISINFTLVFTIFNFILLVFVLKAILFKPMMKYLDERARKIEESLKQQPRRLKEHEHDEQSKQVAEPQHGTVPNHRQNYPPGWQGCLSDSSSAATLAATRPAVGDA